MVINNVYMPISRGNKKIGKDTLIINITSATDCVSALMGLCEIQEKCYAKIAERIYPAVLPYRRRQTIMWDKMTSQQIANQIIEIAIGRIKNKIRYVRMQESGDFRHQADVNKMSDISEILKPEKIKMYTYTARKDLDFSDVSKNLCINGSRFMVDNNYMTCYSINKQNPTCSENCRLCHLCKTRKKITIYSKIK